MDHITLASHAKVNLTLEVSGKREDGYHDIDSVVQVIDIADELVICKAPEGVIEVSSDTEGVPSGPDNLVHRACRTFFDATGVRAGARCELIKHIPAQAGLGGGSGDAAAAIVGLNQLYECGLATEKLAEIAASVGSDAPLFVYGGTVRMRGRGERIEVLPDAPELQLVVVKPDVGVSTAWAYGELDRAASRDSKGASDAAERAIRSQDCGALIESLYNDFDPVVSGAFGEIAAAKRLLTENGALGVLLAGSGSAVFGVFAGIDEAGQAAANIGSHFAKVFLTRTSPRWKAVSDLQL